MPIDNTLLENSISNVLSEEGINSVENPPVNKYDSAVDSVISQEKSMVNASLYQANPVEARKTYSQAKQNNIKPELLKYWGGEKKLDYNSVIKNSPSLSPSLMNPNLAPIVADDVEGLSYWDKWVGDLKQRPEIVNTQFGLGDLGTKKVFGQTLSSDEEFEYNRLKSFKPTDYNLSMVGGAIGQVYESGLQFVGLTTKALPYGGVGATAGGVVGGLAGTALGAVIPTVGEEPLTIGGGTALGARIGGGTGMKAGLTLEGSKLEMGNAYAEFEELTDSTGTKIDPDIARGGALFTGIANGALEYLGFSGIAKQLPYADKVSGYLARKAVKEKIKAGISNQVFKRIGKAMAQAGATEGTTEFLQELTTVVTGEVAKFASSGEGFGITKDTTPESFSDDFSNWLADASERAVEAGGAGAIGGAGLGGVFKGADEATRAYINNRSFKKEQKNISDAVEQTKSNKTFKESKEAWIDITSQSAGKETLYAPAEKVKELFQSDIELYNEFTSILPEVKEQMDEALQTGGNLVLPANKVIAALASNDKFQSLQEFLRYTPESLSNNEYDDEILNRVYNDVVTEEPKEITPVKEIEQFVEKQLYEAGLSPYQVQANMAVFGARIKTEIANESDPEVINAIKQSYRDLIIQKVATQRDVTDDYINMARDSIKPKKPSFPLIDKLKKMGGVRKDSILAGELVAAGFDPKRLKGVIKDNGTVGDIDNLPAIEFQQEFGLEAVPEENGYVDRQFILDSLKSEIEGSPLQSATTQSQNAAIDDFRRNLEDLGLDINKLSNEEIKNAIASDTNIQNGIVELQQEASYIPDAIPEKAQEVTQKAIELAGLTDNPLEAGFITFDGKMLDLSGRNEATGYENINGKFVATKDDYLKGKRNADHTDFAQQMGYDGSSRYSGNREPDPMYLFQKESMAVRVDFKSGFISAPFKPTEKQIRTIISMAQKAGVDVLTVDYADLPNKIQSNAEITNINPRNIKRVFTEELQGETLFQSINGSSDFGTNYHRVMPRDSFNEAKTLSMNLKFIDDFNKGELPEGFEIQINEGKINTGLSEEGDLFLDGVEIDYNGTPVKLTVGYNAGKESKYPLYATSEDLDVWGIRVYDDVTGKLNSEFIEYFGDNKFLPSDPIKVSNKLNNQKNYLLQQGVIGLWQVEGLLPNDFVFELKNPNKGFKLKEVNNKVSSGNLDFSINGTPIKLFLDTKDNKLKFSQDKFQGEVLSGREMSNDFKSFIASKTGDNVFINNTTSKTLFQSAAPTESDVFKKWFGDSKVVDESGKPLVVYHGTNAEINAFDKSFFNTVEKRGDYIGEGFFFTPEKDKAEKYAKQAGGNNIIPTYLSIQNPFIPPADFFDKMTDDELVTFFDVRPSEMREKLIAQGYDGLVDKKYNQYAVFEPTQIKSINNRGTFDPNDARILFQSAPRSKFYKVNQFKTEEGKFASYDIVKKATDVRRPSLFTVHENPQGWIVRNAIVPDEMQKQGIATDFYIEMNLKSLESTGKPLRSTRPRKLISGEVVHELSDSGIKLWDSLVRKGVAKKISEKNYEFLPTNKLFQGQNDKRASIQFAPSGKSIISLFEKRDLSSFMHESAHFWLESRKKLIQNFGGRVSESTRKDYKNTFDWFEKNAKDIYRDAKSQVVDDAGGLEFVKNQIKNQELEILGDGSASDAVAIAMHEYYARGFEAYLAKGEAPSIGLRDAFRNFKAWLISVYKNVSLQVNISAEITDVFDRMLATQEQIDAVRSRVLFKPDAEIAKLLTKAELADYIKRNDNQIKTAEEKLLKKLLKDKSKKEKDWYKAEKAKIEKEVEAMLQASPLNKVVKYFKDGTDFDGNEYDLKRLKLNRKEIKQKYPNTYEKLPSYIFGKDNFVAPEMVADMFGYGNATDMLGAIASAPSMQSEMKRITEQTLLERYGDALKDGTIEREALNAMQNNDRASRIEYELQVINRKANIAKIAFKDQSRLLAIEILYKKKIGDSLNLNSYYAAEVTASRESGKALARKDFKRAAEYKTKQLLNHFLYTEGLKLSKQKESAETFFRQIFKPDSKLGANRNIELIIAARALLAKFGYTRGKADPMVALEKIKKTDPDLYDDLQLAVSAAGLPSKNFKNLNFDEFAVLHNAIKNLWNLSRREKLMEVEGKLVARQKVVADLVSTLDKVKKPKALEKYNRASTKWEKTKIALLGLKSSLLRFEGWVDSVEGLEGNFRKYIHNPVTEAINAYRAEKTTYLKQFRKLVTSVKFTNTPITAPELIDSSGRGFQFNNKQELLHALLHTGNPSNKLKLLVGYGWGTLGLDGTLDASQWDRFLRRMWKENILTKEDYDFVQGTWDLFEEMKPKAWEAHRKMYGYYPSEIIAESFETPFGTYKGGYAPAIYDPFKTQDVSIKQEIERIEDGGNSSQIFPSVGRGFTMGRVFYNKPLALNISLIPSHIDKVTRLSNIGSVVKDVGRIFKDKGFQDSLFGLDQTLLQEMMLPWLNRVASQSIEAPVKGVGANKLATWARALRKRSGLVIMFGNLTNALQQLTGVSIAALKVEPKYLAKAAWKFSTGSSLAMKDIREKSVFMANRTDNQMFEVIKDINDFIINPTKYDKVKDFADRNAYFLQTAFQNYVDGIVWIAGYDKSVESGKTEKQAVRDADSIVRQTQGTFNPEDISKLEGGNAFLRLFLQFYSYFNMQANAVGSEVAKTIRELGFTRKSAPKLFYIYATGLMIPMVMAEAIVKAMSGEDLDAEDDGYLDDILSLFFGSQLRGVGASIPIIGQATTYAINLTNDKPYDDRMSTSPVISIMESTIRGGMTLGQVVTSDEELNSRDIKDISTAIGMLTGVPATPIGKALSYQYGVSEGKVRPEGTIDYTRGLLTGKAGN